MESAKERFEKILAEKIWPLRAHLSPDRKYALVIAFNEFARGQEVNSGVIYDGESGEPIVVLGNEYWHIDSHTWIGQHDLKLEMRHYPGDVPGLELLANMDRSVGQVISLPEIPAIAFSDLGIWLETYYREQGGNPAWFKN